MRKNQILNFLFLFFILLAIFSGYKIISILTEYRSGENTYHEVQQYVHLPETEAPTGKATEPAADPEETEATTEPEEDPILFPEVDFDALLEVNEDVVAWVYIEDTNINYPVVRGKDNDRYLTTMIDGSYNGAGTIFMDYRNQPDLSDPHTILYGHNMKNNTMFANILKYRDQEFYDAHPVGMLMTPDQNYQFEIITAYVAEPNESAWQLAFLSDEEALNWALASMRRSAFSCDTVPALGDKFLTLSTCSYEFNDARFVLVGIVKEAG